MNALQEPLRAALERGGARAVALFAMDGMPVATEGSTGDVPVDALAASFADLARRAAGAGRECGLPDPEEIVVGTHGGWLALRVVTAEYAVLALVDGDGILGRARHELHLAALALRAELEA